MAVGAEEGAGDGSHAWIVDVMERASMAAGLDRITLRFCPRASSSYSDSGVNEARVVTDLTRELHTRSAEPGGSAAGSGYAAGLRSTRGWSD